MKLLSNINIFVVILIFISSSTGNKIYEELTENENYLLEKLTPYRESIKTWVDNLVSDVSPQPQFPNAEYVTCDVCQIIHPIITDNLAAGATSEEIMVGIIRLCINLEIQPEDVCDGIVRSYGESLLYIIINRPDLSKDDLCGILNPGCTPVSENLTNWDIQVDLAKPPVQTLPPLPNGLESSKILQFTDVHLDLDYVLGSNADCGKPLCCRDGIPETDNMTAGLYGHINCALNTMAYDAMLDHAATAHGEIKYIFLTGDYVHNGVWFYGIEENGKNIRHVTQKLVERFPNTPIYPLTGNHEPQVVNMYPPEELWSEGFDLSWLYKEVSDPFANWLGPDQLATFSKGGYYTIKPEPSLRLVVVNTNLCYLNNFWLPYDTHDPTGQLQWFANTMLEAEKDGDNVYILGHIPTGSGDCWPIWSQHFDRIVNRFENLIRGQFYGHEHTESFAIPFERGTDRPLATSTMFLGPSGVPSGASSGYKVYTVDGERQLESTFEIIDHESWILNTTASNENNSPVFEKVYSAKEEYGLNSLRGDDLYDFVIRMLTDESLFMKFQKNYVKGYPKYNCDPEAEDFQNCKMGLLCNTVKSYSGDFSHCERLEEIVNGTTIMSV